LWQIEPELVVENHKEYYDIIENLKKEFPNIIRSVDSLLMIVDEWTPGFRDLIKSKDFSKDRYIYDPGLYEKYRLFKTKPGEVIDFNHSSIVRPFKEVFEAAKEWKFSINLEEKARKYAASIVGLKDSSKVLFARNTTEALNYTYWLAKVGGGNVVLTDAENHSIINLYKEHKDQGNTNKEVGFSTFPDKSVAEKYEGFSETQKTNVNVKIAPILEEDDYEKVLKQINEDTKLVVISHVLRNSGRIVDIESFAKKVKEKYPETLIAVDGAQAIGVVPRVNFVELGKCGVDFYAIATHKFLGSYPFGILYLSENMKNRIPLLQNKKPLEQVIMSGMIPKKYGIKPNVQVKLNYKRYVSLISAIDKLRKEGFNEDNDFSNRAEFVEKLKKYFINKLKKYNIVIDSGKEYSPAIVTFRFNLSNQRVVEKLQKKGIFVSYISETDNVRVSFDITNTENEINSFFDELDLILAEEN